MAKVAKRGLRKTGLIKKGAPHPTSPSFKFDSAHLTESNAEKAEHRLLESPKVDRTLRIKIPKQHLVYQNPVRITPKVPKLRR